MAVHIDRNSQAEAKSDRDREWRLDLAYFDIGPRAKSTGGHRDTKCSAEAFKRGSGDRRWLERASYSQSCEANRCGIQRPFRNGYAVRQRGSFIARNAAFTRRERGRDPRQCRQTRRLPTGTRLGSSRHWPLSVRILIRSGKWFSIRSETNQGVPANC